jgi:phosphodiesterase/alkaline phosphatase D-like protein
MNQGNRLLTGIVVLLVIIIGTIVVIALTRERPLMDTLTPVEVATSTQMTPTQPVSVEPTTVTPPLETDESPAAPTTAAPAPTTTVTKPSAVATSKSGTAPRVTTLGTSSLSPNGIVLHGMLDTGNAESYYSFQYGTTTQFGQVTRFAPIDGSTSPKEVTLAVSNLIPGTTYYYRLNAQNAFGKAQGMTNSFTTPANSLSFTTTYPSTSSTHSLAPGVVTQEVSSISTQGAVFNGRLDTHNTETYYSFQYGTSESLGYETRVAPIAGSTTVLDVSLAVYDLSPRTQYYYRLHAHNQYGTTYGTINRFTTI